MVNVSQGQQRLAESRGVESDVKRCEGGGEWDGASSSQLLQRSDGLIGEYPTVCGWKQGGFDL